MNDKNNAAVLRAAVRQKEEELTLLRRQLAALESCMPDGQHEEGSHALAVASTGGVVKAPSSYQETVCAGADANSTGAASEKVVQQTSMGAMTACGLTFGDVARYSRQLILPELGVSGQLRLAAARLLVVGCGGLGCPASIYLAAAGVGTIGLLDYDVVEVSNLHRQVLHSESKVGMHKVDSVAASLAALNSSVKLVLHRVVLDSSTALDVLRPYDIVLDCTDNVATRYLLNDACVLLKKPLVSGAALRFEGQLTVYNHQDGPCYRCLFPSPPPAETVTNCSDGGVVGVVPGVIGSMQALEAIKIITNIGSTLSSSMLVFDGYSSLFRKIKLRSRQAGCAVCGDAPTVTQLIDYVQFCGAAAADKDGEVQLLGPEARVTVEAYNARVNDLAAPSHVLVDVRQPVELEICSLPNAINVPLMSVTEPEGLAQIKQALEEKNASEVICLCRRGNDSQKAAVALAEALGECDVKDLAGGLTRWAKVIETTMPIY